MCYQLNVDKEYILLHQTPTDYFPNVLLIEC